MGFCPAIGALTRRVRRPAAHGRMRGAGVIVGVLAALLACWPCVSAAEAPAAGKAYALLLGAMPGEELFARHYRDWLKRFHAHLAQKAGVAAENILVLSGDKDFKDPIVSGLATADAVRKALADLAAKAKPQDQFILFMVGHGVVTDQVPTFVLPGPDISAQDLADGLAGAAARNQVVLNLSSASGAMLSRLARPGRVNISATSPIEGNEPVFPEFLLRAIEAKPAGTLLDAYNGAAREAALWISRAKVDEGEGWRIDGKESVAIFEKLYGSQAGAASPFRLAPGSDRTRPDEAVAIVPEGGKIDESWLKRRVLSEHAMLEDGGEKDGVAAVGKEGYAPLDGKKPGEPGHLARRVVLGKAELLRVEP